MIEIVKHTGQIETITETVDGEEVTREQEILEVVKTYPVTEPDTEDSMKRKAALVAASLMQETGEQHSVRVAE